MKDLKAGIVSNASDAGRVALAARTLAEVLLRDDPRVQAAYQEWVGRNQQLETGCVSIVAASLLDAIQHLVSLTSDLGLVGYRWLPRTLLEEFIRHATGATAVEWTLDVPAEAWFEKGRKPKTGAHSEDVPRWIEWFYRTRVKQPRDSVYRIAHEYKIAAGISEANGYVRICIDRVATLLDAIRLGYD